MPLKRISVHNTTYPIDRTFNLFDASSVAGSSTSGAYLSVRWYTTNVEGLITEPYNGMKIAVKIPKQGVSTAGVVLSINGNNTDDYHPVAYNVSTALTSHYAVGAIKTFVYDATATMACYLTSNTKTTVTGVWKAEADYDSNTTMTYGTLAYYLRPYAAQTIYDYRFVMQDKDNRLVPLVTDNIKLYNSGTSYTVGTKIFYSGVFYNCIAAGKGKTPPNATYWEVITPTLTPTAMAFKPDKIYWYNTTTTIAAGAAIGGNTLMSVGYNATNISTGNFPVLVPTYKMIYLCGTYNQTTGLFTLRDGGTASNNYYTLVPDNTANLTLSTYFTEGYDYILLGGSYSTAGYIHLREDHPMYHFDGTNLVPYDTYDINTQVQANPTLAGTENALTGLQVGDTKYKIVGNEPFIAVYETDYNFSEGASDELLNLSNDFKAAIIARKDFIYSDYRLGSNPVPVLKMKFEAEATTGATTSILIYTSEFWAFSEVIQRAIVTIDTSTNTVGISTTNITLPRGLCMNDNGNVGFYDGDMTTQPFGLTVASSDIVEAGLPTFSSSDVNKVLSIDSNGDLIWITAQAGPMVFKGTLGTGGTITSLPTASASTLGWTYKVIEDGTYASIPAKEGDLFICANAGTDQSPTYVWTLVPAGDDIGVEDVTVNGTSVVAEVSGRNIAQLLTQTAYNASTNKIATVEDTKIKTITIAASQAVSDTEFVLTNEQFNIIQNNEVVNIATDWWPLHTVYRSFKDYVGTYTAFSRMQLNGIDDAELEESHIIVVTNSERVDYKHAYLIEHVIVDANPTTSVSTPDLTSITIRGTNYKIPITSLSINDTDIAPVSGNINLVTNQAYDASTNKLATMTDVNKKLDKLTYEWNKEVAMGSSGYVKIGSFPMYDTNITIDIDATTSTSYHGTAIVVTQNTSTSSMGSAHKVDVYGDPTGIIASSLRVVWTNGSRNYDIYFVPQSWSKNVIHIRAVALADTPDESTICQKITSGSAPSTTEGITITSILKVKDVQVNGTSVASNGVVNLITNSAYNASTNKLATMADVPTDTNTTTDLLTNTKQLNSWIDSIWSSKSWTGLTSFAGNKVWTDGNNIYYSELSFQYVLNKSTSTWTAKTWTNLSSFYGQYIWTDGTNIYYSMDANHYVLDKSTSTWSTKSWTGLTVFDGINIWTDGTDIYCSRNSKQYILNKATSTWTTKTWTGLSSFYGDYIWTDGTNIYYSEGSTQKVLNGSTWSNKTWTGLSSFYGHCVWTDGTNIYYSNNEDNYILDKATSTWTAKTWTGLSSFYGHYIWTDRENIYYSSSSTQYVLNKNTQVNPSCKTKLGYDYETQIINKPDLPKIKRYI